MVLHHRSSSFAAARLLAAWSVAAAIGVFVSPVSAQTWTDRSEYDIVLAVRAEPAPAKRLELIEQWKQKFPKSELRNVRAELQLAACEALGDTARMLSIAREMTANDPRSFVGAYWITVLAPSTGDVSRDFLAQVEKAARTLLADAPDFFSPDRKPQGNQGADWQKQRTRVEVLAHRTLGWIQWERAAYDLAEREFLTVLQTDPTQVETSSWLGTVLALQKTPEKQLQAIWHLARAAYLSSDSSPGPAWQGETRSLLERVYAVYHGDTDGLEKIGAVAVTAITPPADFRIETAQEAALRKQDDELSRTNPDLLVWLKIRRQLEGADGQKNFDALAASGMPKLKGFVVRHSPATKPTEIVIGFQGASVEELVLSLDAPLAGSAEPGTPIEFEAKPVSFTAQPFLLHVQGEREKVMGWPSLHK